MIRQLHEQTVASVIAKEGQDEDGDDMDDLLDEEMEDAAAAALLKGKGKGKRRQGPGFDDQQQPAAPTKGGGKKGGGVGAAKKRLGAKVKAEEANAATATSAAPTATPPKQQVSGKASATSVASLDNEMQLVAKHHMQTEGSSIKALENLSVEFYLTNADGSRYQHSAKLRGVTSFKLQTASRVLFLLCNVM